jgi:3-oxoacyl-[acyl-carrier protein] reductase
MDRLKGKVAVVTGASREIGAYIAKHLAAAGAAVVVNYATDQTGAKRVVNEITRDGGKAADLQADVSKRDEVERLFNQVRTLYGRLDILVNNAAMIEFSTLEQITDKHVEKQFKVNLLGPILATQSAVRHFGTDGGSVINVSSETVIAPLPGIAIYAATKSALETITQAFANELRGRKIRVNVVSPSLTKAEGMVAASVLETSELKHCTSLPSFSTIGRPSSIAEMVVFLASSDSGWMTGETLRAGSSR